jgi:hypothetical protein
VFGENSVEYATQNLPIAYHEAAKLDISKDTRLLFILNLVGVVILLIAGWVFYLAMAWLRPEVSSLRLLFLSRRSLLEVAKLILAIIGLTGVNLVFHEGIHGVFFWIFSHSRPEFAFRGAYAYAAAPGWYMPKNAFLITTLAPLLVISLAGLALMWVVPPTVLAAVWFVVTMNASGSVGDLFVCGWILCQTSPCYIQDCGDVLTLYLPGKS